jgi:O-antigen ligase
MSLTPDWTASQRELSAVGLWLTASLTMAVIGNIPVSDGDGIQQPALRAIFLLMAFGSLVLAAQRVGLSVTAPWRFFPVVLAGFLLWCAASVLWSVSAISTALRITETSLTFLYLQSFVFVAAITCASSKELAKLIAISFSTAVVGGLAINVLIFGTPFHFWLNPDVPERPRFTFGFLHPLATGDILAICILATVFSDLRLWLKILIAMSAFVLLQTSDSTGARFAILGIVPLVLLLYGDSQSWRWIKFFIACMLFAISALIFIGYFFDSPTMANFDQQNARLLTLTGRVTIWKAVINNGLAFTGFGYGFDASRYVIGPLVGKAYHAHNQFLNVLVELGIVGFAVFAALVVLWVWRLVKSGGLFSVALCVYVLLLSINNPGLFTKLPVMLVFMVSYYLPLFFPRQLHQGLLLASVQTAQK